MASKPSTYEYLLFGGIYERQLDCMLDRLRGLCDHNHLIQFKDREIFYGLSESSLKFCTICTCTLGDILLYSCARSNLKV